MRKSTSYCVLSGAALAVVAFGARPVHAAEVIYSFDDGAVSGFTGNNATTSASTTTGVVTAPDSLSIANRFNQTYGGGITATVPADFYNATSFTVDVTIPAIPMVNGAAVYFDLVPVFFSTDGEIDPDTSNASNFINLGALTPGTTTPVTVNLAAYFDPEGNLTTDATPGAILAADRAFDGTTTDAITGFQLTVEHGTGSTTATTVFVDNLTVPSATAVPEPASLGLLAVGGLATLGRRRRHLA